MKAGKIFHYTFFFTADFDAEISMFFRLFHLSRRDLDA